MYMYIIPTDLESYNTFEGNWAACTQIEKRLPYTYINIVYLFKTIFLTMCLPAVLITNNNFQNSYGSQDIYQYILDVVVK